eukprot:gene7078-11241_t
MNVTEDEKTNSSDSLLDTSTTYSSTTPDYEKIRQKNIEKNKKFFQDLGYNETKKEVKKILFEKKKEIKTVQKTREPKINKKRKKSSQEDELEPMIIPQQDEEPKIKIDGIFSGLYFYLFEGINLRQKRSQILKERIEENGGIICESFSLKTTHIISSASFKTLQNSIKGSLRGVQLHTPEWISEALRNKEKLSENEFRIFHSHREIEKDVDVVQKEEPIIVEKTEMAPKKKFKFSCEKSEKETFNHNEELTSALEKLENIYLLTGDVWRSLAYRKSIRVLKSLKFKVKMISELKDTKGIGEKTMEKIKEYLNYGSINRLDKLEQNESVQVVSFFSSIFGVGPKTAMKWYQKGYKTIDDLEEKCELTHQQKIGIKYHSDLQEKIPREEVEEIENKVKSIILKINPNLVITICGSYRRGSKTCGDVDILIMDPLDNIEDLLTKVIDSLTKVNFLKAHLTSSFEKSNSYMGVCKIKELNRRIDIKVYPKDQYAFALLYFTGSNYFNRSMRYYAEKKGYSLGDKSLKKFIRVSKEKVHESDGIECTNEKEIFDALGLDYKEPHERNL